MSNNVNGGVPAVFLPKDTDTFRVVRDGKLYHLEKRPEGALHNKGYVYARWEGAKMLTAIHPQTHVVVVSLKTAKKAVTIDTSSLLSKLRAIAIATGTDGTGVPTLQFTETDLVKVVESFVGGKHEPQTTVAER